MDQPSQTQDLGVSLHLGPLDGRDSNDLDFEVVESPGHNIAPPDFPQEPVGLHPDELVSANLGPVVLPKSNVCTSSLQPKWWAKTIGDFYDDMLIEGRLSRNKSKQ